MAPNPEVMGPGLLPFLVINHCHEFRGLNHHQLGLTEDFRDPKSNVLKAHLLIFHILFDGYLNKPNFSFGGTLTVPWQIRIQFLGLQLLLLLSEDCRLPAETATHSLREDPERFSEFSDSRDSIDLNPSKLAPCRMTRCRNRWAIRCKETLVRAKSQGSEPQHPLCSLVQQDFQVTQEIMNFVGLSYILFLLPLAVWSFFF